jgi:1,4-alpha-glucan branching enzyme
MTTDTMQRDVERIVRGDHDDPFAVLGPHMVAGGTVVTTFQPQARGVQAVDSSGAVLGDLTRIHDAGVFAGALYVPPSTPYRLRLDLPEGTRDIDDPYRFPPVLGDLDVHLLREGTHMRLYERLGAHVTELLGVPGISFAVWAPNAKRVSVVGDFNEWDRRRHPMRLRRGSGLWELFVPGLDRGELYKFDVRTAVGEPLPLKADPFALYSERRPGTASLVHGITRRAWRDGDWMARRGTAIARDAPVAIYEVHAASWQRDPGRWDGFPDWEQLAERLVPYVRDLGFTHIELLPISEHPLDASWGYQPLGLYAPTSRHGPPEGLQAFVEACHRAGLGVLMDWVVGHFPTDEHGLGLFDGSHLYEQAHPYRGHHPDWHTLLFDYAKPQVVNYLLGNALYWLDVFHIDGFRVDAVASMLYLDYNRPEGQWIPNRLGGNENLEAIEFLKRFNVEVPERFPGAATVAEESTVWPGVSEPVAEGGLGFGFKWNMGWMNDTLGYVRTPFEERPEAHDKMTFGLLYAFSEHFILPLSHDEVVHGKASLLGRMPGDDAQKFAGLRAYYAFMWAHPGKKLLFMGGELAQWREWDEGGELDWGLLAHAPHRGVQSLIRDLNRLYRRVPALHQRDGDSGGFEWVVVDDAGHCVFAWLRHGRPGTAPVLAVANFAPQPHADYPLRVPYGGPWHVAIDTDAACYGGSGTGRTGPIEARLSGNDRVLSLTLPALTTLFLMPGRPGEAEAAAGSRGG